MEPFHTILLPYILSNLKNRIILQVHTDILSKILFDKEVTVF